MSLGEFGLTEPTVDFSNLERVSEELHRLRADIALLRQEQATWLDRIREAYREGWIDAYDAYDQQVAIARGFEQSVSASYARQARAQVQS